MNLTWDNNLGSSHNSCAQDMTLLLRIIKEFDPGDILMSSFSNFTTISEEATFILNEIHKRFDAESKNVDRNQFMRLVIKSLSWRAMASNLPNALSDSGVNQETPPFEITQPIQEKNVGYEGGGVDGVTYETANQCPDEIQYATANNGMVHIEEEEEPAQSLPLLVDSANNPPFSGTSDADDIHPEVRKFFGDNQITHDHLTKPKYATALPVPPDLVEKYFLYKQKKLLSDQSSPPPKEEFENRCQETLENCEIVAPEPTADELLNGAGNAYCTDGIDQAQGNHVSSAPMTVTSPPIQV